jgi:hypothetical protein
MCLLMTTCSMTLIKIMFQWASMVFHGMAFMFVLIWAYVFGDLVIDVTARIGKPLFLSFLLFLLLDFVVCVFMHLNNVYCRHIN